MLSQSILHTAQVSDSYKMDYSSAQSFITLTAKAKVLAVISKTLHNLALDHLSDLLSLSLSLL